MKRISVTSVAAAILYVGLLTTTVANASPAFTHKGACEVNENGKLTGLCRATCQPYNMCCGASSAECPAGRRARKVEVITCGSTPDRIDPKKLCQFQEDNPRQ